VVKHNQPRAGRKLLRPNDDNRNIAERSLFHYPARHRGRLCAILRSSDREKKLRQKPNHQETEKGSQSAIFWSCLSVENVIQFKPSSKSRRLPPRTLSTFPAFLFSELLLRRYPVRRLICGRPP
jgi:hypothetical protein